MNRSGEKLFAMYKFFDLRVCWGQDRRGQTGVGVKVRELPKTQVKTKKTGVITLNITPV